MFQNPLGEEPRRFEGFGVEPYAVKIVSEIETWVRELESLYLFTELEQGFSRVLQYFVRLVCGFAIADRSK